MCTIALAWNVLADAPVAIAANRDEALDRESHPPRCIRKAPAVVAPQDARAGGTWIGVSERGLVVAITNRWTESPEEPGGDAAAGGTDGRRSRGLLVRGALAADGVDDALQLVRDAVQRERYAGFNLLLADADRAAYLEWDGAAPDATTPDAATTDAATTDAATPDAAAPDATATTAAASEAPELRVRDLDPGVHAIVNPGLNGDDERAARLREALAVEGTAPGAGAWLDAAAERLRDHDFDVCVHGDGFGTRSSSLLALGTDGSAAYAFADGPPCETPYEQVTAAFLEGSF